MSFWSQLTKKLHKPKFSCAQTKRTTTIVNAVFAPLVTAMVTQDLEQVGFVFNYGHVEMLPIMVRFGKAN